MKQQDYSNHRRYVPGFHFVTSSLIMILVLLAANNMARLWGKPEWWYAGFMPLITSIILLLLFWYTRRFPLAVQNRAIRAEESLRHYILTGKPIDPLLTTNQIIALRFASDEELPALSQRAIDENMKPEDIKKAIKKWRGDFHRA